ncbi:MAG: hypothetical protein KJ017_02915 [Alphaproteobacteria bacterium]|nr:hypothetical protein [Alphaproteobacteria bacterium]
MTAPRRALLLALALMTIGAQPTLAQREKLRAAPGKETPKLPAEVIKEEAKLETQVYQPEYCDFFATFPGEPIKSRRCEEEAPDRCYDLVSYTKVFGLSSTVRAEIICNPLPEGAYDDYTPEVMKQTVESMAMGEVMQGYEPNVIQEANFKQAGMIGRGRAGMGDTIFVAQLWVGKRSILAVQAEMMGEPSEEADAHFAEILRSIGYQETEEEKAQRLEAEKKAADEAAKNPVKPADENKDASAPQPETEKKPE